MDGVDDLALGHLLAAADDIAVERVLRNKRSALFHGHLVRAIDLRTGGIVFFIYRRGYEIRRALGKERADGGRGGQAGRLDADGIQKARRALGLADNEIVLILLHMRAQAGKARDRAVAGERGDALPGLLHDALEPRGGRVRRFGVLHIHGGRAHEEIAVNGRRYENALAHFRGKLEHGAREHMADLFIKQHIFALARRDRELLFGDHVVELGAVESRGVDDDRSLKAPFRRFERP